METEWIYCCSRRKLTQVSLTFDNIEDFPKLNYILYMCEMCVANRGRTELPRELTKYYTLYNTILLYNTIVFLSVIL